MTGASPVTLETCIVGCGKVAGWRLKDLIQAKELTIAAAVDPAIERACRLAARYRAAGHPTEGAERVDDPRRYGLAVINTPNGLHRACAEPFIENGVPVVIEKPLALTVEDVDWFRERERAGAWICGAYNSRFSARVAEAFEMSRGETIVSILATKTRHRAPSYYEDGWHGTWRYDGGVLAQQAIHCIDLACWFAGDMAPRRVAAIGSRRRHDIECEDTGSVLLDFGDFAAVVMGTTAAGRDDSATVQIVTTDGVYGTEDWGWDDGAGPLWREIAASLTEGRSAPVTAASAAHGLMALHAAYVSIDRGGQWVEVGEAYARLGRP